MDTNIEANTGYNTGYKTIAICQIEVETGDVEGNINRIIQWMQKAAHIGADLVLFGEMITTNYDLHRLSSVSQTKDGPLMQRISQAAKNDNISVILGYSEKDEENKYHNSMIFFNSEGNRIANYRKVHVWPTEKGFEKGDKISVVNWEGINVGLAICADVCFPEFIRCMVTNASAQLIVVANALVEGDLYHNTPLYLVPARAVENRCYIAYFDLAGKSYQGMSRLCNPNGKFQVSAHTSEETMLLTKIPVDVHESVPFHYIQLLRSDVYSAVTNDQDKLS